MTKKFRIWNGQKFLNEEEHSLYISQSGYLVHIDTVGEQSLTSDNNKVSWWTGLTNSQGVEIYEGDFVKAGAIKGKINFYKSAYYINEQLLIDVYVLLAGNIKIIGNVFQNPELLEKC